MTDDHDRCEWVNISSGTGSPGLSRTTSREIVEKDCYGCVVKWLCVCVCNVKALIPVVITAISQGSSCYMTWTL